MTDTACETTDYLSEPLQLYRGDTWIFPLAFSDPAIAPAIVGAAQDLTGYTPRGFLLIANQAPIALEVAPQADDNLLADGLFRLVATPAMTATIPGDQRTPFSRGHPVRVQVQTVDPTGVVKTVGVIPITVLVA